MRNNLTIYGCGGAGINTALAYMGSAEAINPPVGTAKPSHVLVDTSYSNVDIDDPKQADVFYRISDANVGSGGLRGENLDPIRRGMKDFLIKHPASEMNIVVFSASGGSGSTIGPVLIQELLSDTDDKTLVAVVYVDWSTELRTRNSFNTIRTLENIAERLGKSIVIFPVNNEARGVADMVALQAIYHLAILFANTHAELDNADIYNFINYNRVTSYPPKVASINVYQDNGKPEETIGRMKNLRPVSVAMIHSNLEASDKYKSSFVTGYNCEGFSSEDVSPKGGSIIYSIGIEEIRNLRSMLDQEMKKYLDANNAAIDAVSKDDKPKHITESTVDGDFVL